MRNVSETNTLFIFPGRAPSGAMFATILHNESKVHPQKKCVLVALNVKTAQEYEDSFKRMFGRSVDCIALLPSHTPLERRNYWRNGLVPLIFTIPQVLQNDLLNGNVRLDLISTIIFHEIDYLPKMIIQRVLSRFKEAQMPPRFHASINISISPVVEKIQEFSALLDVQYIASDFFIGEELVSFLAGRIDRFIIPLNSHEGSLITEFDQTYTVKAVSNFVGDHPKVVLPPINRLTSKIIEKISSKISSPSGSIELLKQTIKARDDLVFSCASSEGFKLEPSKAAKIHPKISKCLFELSRSEYTDVYIICSNENSLTAIKKYFESKPVNLSLCVKTEYIYGKVIFFDHTSLFRNMGLLYQFIGDPTQCLVLLDEFEKSYFNKEIESIKASVDVMNHLDLCDRRPINEMTLIEMKFVDNVKVESTEFQEPSELSFVTADLLNKSCGPEVVYCGYLSSVNVCNSEKSAILHKLFSVCQDTIMVSSTGFADCVDRWIIANSILDEVNHMYVPSSCYLKMTHLKSAAFRRNKKHVIESSQASSPKIIRKSEKQRNDMISGLFLDIEAEVSGSDGDELSEEYSSMDGFIDDRSESTIMTSQNSQCMRAFYLQSLLKSQSPKTRNKSTTGDS